TNGNTTIITVKSMNASMVQRNRSLHSLLLANTQMKQLIWSDPLSRPLCHINHNHLCSCGSQAGTITVDHASNSVTHAGCTVHSRPVPFCRQQVDISIDI